MKKYFLRERSERVGWIKGVPLFVPNQLYFPTKKQQTEFEEKLMKAIDDTDTIIIKIFRLSEKRIV